MEAHAQETVSAASISMPAEASAEHSSSQISPSLPVASLTPSEAKPVPSFGNTAQTAAEVTGDASDGEEDAKQDGWSLVTSVKDKLPSRRRPCVCGSGKRYKNCCGVPKGAAARRKKAEQERVENVQTGVQVPMSNLYI